MLACIRAVLNVRSSSAFARKINSCGLLLARQILARIPAKRLPKQDKVIALQDREPRG